MGDGEQTRSSGYVASPTAFNCDVLSLWAKEKNQTPRFLPPEI
jgi:hypothetical protein